MFLKRHFAAAAATASLLIAGASFVSAEDLPAKGPASGCGDAAGLAVLASPLSPWKGAPLRVVFTAEQPIEGELSLIAPDGKVAIASRDRRGGPPYFWFAEVASPSIGKWQAKLASEGAPGECRNIVRDIEVRKSPSGPPRSGSKSVWPVRDTWNRATENLYSAWIEKLFDAPLEETLSWKALHEVLRDKSRNFLFNHLGAAEDQKGLVIQPDCADLPYFLRAYFAFKMGLPFGYAKCTRGGGGKPPQCPAWWNIQKEEPPPAPPPQTFAGGGGGDLFGFFGGPPPAAARPAYRVPQRPAGLVPGFGFYLRTTVANGVHSGSGRTAADDDDTDYYPVALKHETLRPGAVYADPYGHILVIAKRLPQTDSAAGVLLAVDGQPDGTVSRKRFWRGNFLFAQDPALGGPGFKRFRPIVQDKSGTLRRLSNEEIAKSAEYGDFSLEQSELGIEAFYDRMDDVMSPAPLDPSRAMLEAITALDEQVKARVTSVENGRKYQVGGGGEVAMPDGASIFETTGAWEDFATPSRDLRLLIAIDVVRGFPDRVARRPERYAMPKDKSAADVKAALESTLSSELAARKFAYTRSDGSQWTLALKDVVDRAAQLEMAYNINDCAELRWGAPDNSEETSTCKRRAPGAQRGKMAEYRAWFSERRRPPRG
ncbi:MAG: hypothetical protein K8F92_00620 [Hyphomicrobium sp.]|uniref:hypothetical protein n=1 Tax=Hyphomicrobium sp. TaxID=82 RepID=UPI001329E985|nr:hypothetical protein [Hyphomicrobium sp.]KAB2939286.1 MAG: hypothetical protein F9K20_17465 [Hyphomicrobium sp.]MBZ0208148.1 hypothetical protein [Hyphomicrobium sp.]